MGALLRRRAILVPLSVVALLFSLVSVASRAGAAPSSLDMKLLVIAADGNETDYPAITAFLDHIGVPYDRLIAKNTPLTAAMLSDAPGHGRYYGIVLTTGNLVYYDAATNSWPSAFTTDQWNTLRAYQATFGVRSVTSFTFPEAAYGMTFAGYQDTLGTPLTGTLTTAGRAVFPYLTANPLTFKGAWVYFGTVNNPAVTTPLLTTTVNSQTYPIASVTRYADGHENLAITAANNPFLVHSLVLSYGWLDWVTRGQYLGSRHANWNIQIDDLFIDDDLWDPATNTSGVNTYRNSAQDVIALRNWQNARSAQPNTPATQLAWAFVGTGSVLGTYVPDNLTPAIQQNANQFGFINHTFDHFNLDCGFCPEPTGTITTNRGQVQKEITDNISQGQSLALPSDWDTMVQPDISGLYGGFYRTDGTIVYNPDNPMAQRAAADVGIRYWISDTSRIGQNNPSFNVGWYAPGDSRLYVVPRHPSNLFFSVSTPAEWVSLYNYFYAPGGTLCGITTCFSQPQTYAQILDHESDFLLRYLLQFDLDPLMFHTPNARAYDGTHSVLTDLLDATLAKYSALVNVPIRTLTYKQAGVAEQNRGLYNASGVTATKTPCSNITVHANAAATIPITGVSYSAPNSTVENYAGEVISNVSLTAGQTITIPLPACPAGVAGPAPALLLGAKVVSNAKPAAPDNDDTPKEFKPVHPRAHPSEAAPDTPSTPAPYNPPRGKGKKHQDPPPAASIEPPPASVESDSDSGG